MLKKWFSLLPILLLLSACANIALPGGPVEPTPVPTDCGCSAEGPLKLTPPAGGLSDPAGPDLSGGTGVAQESLDNYRDRWETYTSEAYGLSFEYPAAYTSPAYHFCAVRAEPSPPEGVDYALNLGSNTVITALKVGQGADLASQVEAYRADPARKQIQFEAAQQRMVGGMPAFSLSYHSDAADLSGEVTLFLNESIFYAIESRRPEETGNASSCDIPDLDLTEQNAYERLLDSFQFR